MKTMLEDGLEKAQELLSKVIKPAKLQSMDFENNNEDDESGVEEFDDEEFEEVSPGSSVKRPMLKKSVTRTSTLGGAKPVFDSAPAVQPAVSIK
jgi:hypothetical protein